MTQHCESCTKPEIAKGGGVVKMIRRPRLIKGCVNWSICSSRARVIFSPLVSQTAAILVLFKRGQARSQSALAAYFIASPVSFASAVIAWTYQRSS